LVPIIVAVIEQRCSNYTEALKKARGPRPIEWQHKVVHLNQRRNESLVQLEIRICRICVRGDLEHVVDILGFVVIGGREIFGAKEKNVRVMQNRCRIVRIADRGHMQIASAS